MLLQKSLYPNGNSSLLRKLYSVLSRCIASAKGKQLPLKSNDFVVCWELEVEIGFATASLSVDKIDFGFWAFDN